MLDISIRTLRNKLNEYNFKGQPEKDVEKDAEKESAEHAAA